MKEREKCKKTSHYRPQYAKWFSRYSISKSGICARWTSPFCRFSASFSIEYDVTDAILQDNEKLKQFGTNNTQNVANLGDNWRKVP